MKQKWSTQILKEAQQKDLIVFHPHQEFEKQLKKEKAMWRNWNTLRCADTYSKAREKTNVENKEH